ncbi:MAG: DinB family protein [Pseudomonadota bacterium]
MSVSNDSPAPAVAWLIDENQQALSQLCELVAHLDADDYALPAGADGRHTLGKHVRHIIDHYEALLAGRAVGNVLDYERRRREADLEGSPRLAARRIEAIMARLTEFADTDADQAWSLRYPVDTQLLDLGMTTSLGRELAFLTSHTIHHMAIIGLLAEQRGHELPEAFGVHPSTLRHWQCQSQSFAQGQEVAS